MESASREVDNRPPMTRHRALAVAACFFLSGAAVLVGGTLPLLSRDLVARGSDAGRGIGLLYGLNTLGAVAGALLAGFVTIERMGLVRSLALAAGFNVVAAVVVLALPARPVEPAP